MTASLQRRRRRYLLASKYAFICLLSAMHVLPAHSHNRPNNHREGTDPLQLFEPWDHSKFT